ncbi:MAG: LysM peptidoglycan-binding domain-containing protein [Dehalococcoidia bacterium]|nr:LysM peptidoglycan-binding domain-containing protein [Dehalococcoidia bacterium]
MRSGGHQAEATVISRPPFIPAVWAIRARAVPIMPILAVVYVILIAVAELLTVMTDARWGLALHIGILTALLVQASLVTRQPYHKLLLVLALAPLVRILSLSMPLENLDLMYWYAIVGAPLMIAALLTARTLGLSWRSIGFSVRSLRIQALVVATGLAFGVAEYFILKPKPLIDEFSWGAFWLPALILLIGTGFNEELVFRGVMQSASSDALGKWAILYVTVVFAVLHLGYKSVVDVAFVFAVGLFFGCVVAKTRSLLGVTLSHGITNIALYLVVPFLGIAASTTPSIGVQNVQISPHEFAQEVQRMQALVPPPQIEPIPSGTPTATRTATAKPSPTTTPGPAEAPPPQPTEAPGPTETYIVQPYDSLSDIAAKYETTVDELLRLNDLAEPNLLYTGQAILVPRRSETAASTTVHIVEEGETLGLIAERYGTTVEVLLGLNSLPDPNVVPVGTSLVVPQPP